MKTSSKKWQKIRKIKGLRQFVTWYPRHVSENPGCRTCNNKRNEYPYDKNKYLDPTKVKDISKYFEFKMDGTIKVAKGLTKSEEEKAAYMIDMYKLNRTDLNTERKYFFRDIVNDDKYYDILKNDDKSSMRIIFLSVFTYYKRRNESNGE